MEGLNARRCLQGAAVRPTGSIVQPGEPRVAVAAEPDIELAPGDPEETARLRDVARDLLVVFDYAEPSSDIAALFQGRCSAFHPGPPLCVGYRDDTPSVRDLP